MLTIYGSSMCPNCRECKANLDANGIAYRFIDICESLPNLKAFLALRDELPLFDVVKAEGKIGIPTLIPEDGKILLDWKGYLTAQGLPLAGETRTSAACDVERKHC